MLTNFGESQPSGLFTIYASTNSNTTNYRSWEAGVARRVKIAHAPRGAAIVVPLVDLVETALAHHANVVANVRAATKSRQWMSRGD